MTSYKNLKFEDTLQCSIYSTEELNHITWEELCDSLNKLIDSLSEKYIWHRDNFKICSCDFEEKRKDIPYYLASTTCFGDNIEDEWFIVYLILEITKQYKNIMVQMEDNDGDFLLIEAANYLPSWANPDSTENRVFIYKSKIHIIDPLIAPLNSNLTLKEALRIIKESPEKTEASPEIQKAILNRVGNYPQKIKTVCHRANVTLPAEVAAILMLEATLISPIVSAYCNIDTIDLKKCRDIPMKDNITVKINFTKYLYAMLLNTKPIKSFGLKSTDIDKKCHELGMKLTYGYQVLTKTQAKDITTTLEYKKFFNSLNKNGYFRNNVEGSKEYNELLNKAKNYFIEMESSISSHFNNVICKLKSSPEFNILNTNLLNNIDTELSEDDNEEWLNVNPEQLNDLLDSKYGRRTTFENKEAITSQLSNFLTQTSDFEGIEQRSDNMLNDNNIDFDSEEFVKCVDKMLNLISNNCDTTANSDFSDDDDIYDDINSMAKELASKLHDMPEHNEDAPKKIVNNLIQSIKEEGLSGPSSNILKSIGIHKEDLLDSDDE